MGNSRTVVHSGFLLGGCVNWSPTRGCGCQIRSNFYCHGPITVIQSEGPPEVCSLHGPKHPIVYNLHVSIGITPVVMVTTYN